MDARRAYVLQIWIIYEIGEEAREANVFALARRVSYIVIRI